MTISGPRSSPPSRYRAPGILAVFALLAWGVLLFFTHAVAPQNVPAFLVFFLLLCIALLSTLTPLIYLFTRTILSKRGVFTATLPHALRQSALITAWIIFNLLIRVLHSWNIFTALVSFGIIVVVEILSLGR